MSGMKMKIVALTAVASVAACAAPPLGPTIYVSPAPNKPFQVFAQDQEECKAYASNQTAGQAERANNQAVGGALLGTALGAGLGAAIGGGRGAGIGAASGAIVGTGVGANSSSYAQQSIQQQYDNAYAQCMYSHGNVVPSYAPPPPPPGGGWVMPPPPPQ
jgi:uncharacterized protein YcfJ